MLRRRTGRLRDAPRQGKREWREPGAVKAEGGGCGWVPSILEQARPVQANVTRAGCSGPARARGSVSRPVDELREVKRVRNLHR